MGIQPIACWWLDRFGYSLTNVSDLELTLKQPEHSVGCQQPADSRHLPHIDRFIEQPSGSTVLCRTQDTNDLSPEALEVGQAGV